MKVGVFGGTFDPPHNGHLALAQSAIDHLKLDEVIFVPNSKNPLKVGATASGQQRIELLKRLIQDVPRMGVCDLEIQRGGRSFSVDTLAELTYAQAAEYWFLMGFDALIELENWKQPQRLLRMCRLGVTLRPPHTEVDILARAPEFAKSLIDFVPMDPLEVSSTEIRERIAMKRSIAKFMPPAEVGYIQENKLYEK